MTVNWEGVLRRLHSHGDGVHRIHPPCPADRVRIVEEDLGRMPGMLSEMLRHFNGAELFIAPDGGGEMLTVFMISTDPPPAPMEWAPEWCIDTFTPKWRSAGDSRNTDWAIAMMNYGGLIVLAQDGTVNEWDTSQGRWSRGPFTFDQWLEQTLREGDAYLREQ